MLIRSLRLVAGVAVALLVVSGCGSSDEGSPEEDTGFSTSETADTDSPSSDPSTPEPPSEPSAPETITAVDKAPFCDELVLADLGEAIDESDDVKFLYAYKPGEEVKIDDFTVVSDAWECMWETERTGLLFRIAKKPTTGAAMTQSAKAFAEGGSDNNCSQSKSTAFGDPGLSLTCEGSRGSLSGYYGMFEDTEVRCVLSSSDTKDLKRLTKALDGFCALGLSAVAP